MLTFVITDVKYPLDFVRLKHFEGIHRTLISAQNISSYVVL
jgi:hypothetical protein